MACSRYIPANSLATDLLRLAFEELLIAWADPGDDRWHKGAPG
jgi:hypothetical protein